MKKRVLDLKPKKDIHNYQEEAIEMNDMEEKIKEEQIIRDDFVKELKNNYPNVGLFEINHKIEKRCCYKNC